MVRNRFSERVPVVVTFPEVGLTKPEFKESCDINHILKKYQKTGVIPQLYKDPLYGDFSEVADYQAACDLAIQAQAQFDGLPSEVRKRFGNNPEKFLEWVEKADEKELIEMKLATPRVASLTKAEEPVIESVENPDSA